MLWNERDVCSALKWDSSQTSLAFSFGYGLHQGFTAAVIHTFEGVHLSSDTVEEKEPKKDNFLYKQVASSSSCGGPIMNWIYSGSYHTEHHLFPRMNHLHFPKVRPIVREFCAEKGIPYHCFPGFWDPIKSYIKHLHFLGRNDTYANMAPVQ